MVSQNRNSSSSPVCEEVSVLIDAVTDNRASASERAFVDAHLPRCASCASALAFARAVKTAWARSPATPPPLSLSARIAAATYRKPTFAERFALALAFLQPVPMRVAVGACAAIGIGVLVAPRLTPLVTVSPAMHSATVATTNHFVPVPAKSALPIKRTTKPVTLVAKASKPTTAPALQKPLPPAVPFPVIARAEIKAVLPTITKKIEPKPAPSMAHHAVLVAQKPASRTLATRVAMEYSHLSHLPHPEPLPEEAHHETEIAVAETTKPAAKPETTEPVAAAPASVAGMVARDDEADTSGKLGRRLLNAGRRVEALGSSAAFAATAPDGNYLVQARGKL